VIYTKDAYMYLVVLGVMTVACVVYLAIFFPESPKFLYSKHKYAELESSFDKMKRMNKVGNDVSVPAII
jgi:hypothetical protein